MISIGRKLIFPILPLLVSAAVQAALIPPSQMASPKKIRVRLAEAIPDVSVRGYDLKIGQGAENRLAIAPDQSTAWEFRCQGDRVRAISARGGKAFDLQSPVTVSSPAGLLRFKSRPYREAIRIHALGSLCEVVNELDIEKYLNGLVNAEFSSQWSEQAVQAQVIAARTYALYQMNKARADAHFDVDATVKDQVYDGYVSEDFRGSRAVERTRGIVLAVQNRAGRIEPIKAFYHSSCAGKTELPQNVWGGSFPGFKRSVVCPFCGRSAKISWSLDLKDSDLSKLLVRGASADGAQAGWPAKWAEILRSGRLVGLRAGRVDEGNRLSQVISIWSWHGGRVELPIAAVRFRSWVGPARLKSTSFGIGSYAPAGGGIAWRLAGRGNGHGVGMCQLGAKYMGEQGYKTASILKHYYPDALLRKLW